MAMRNKHKQFLNDNKDVVVPESVVDPQGEVADVIATQHSLVLTDLDDKDGLLELQAQLSRRSKS